jgi:uncharacterized protein (DUF2141 family)
MRSIFAQVPAFGPALLLAAALASAPATAPAMAAALRPVQALGGASLTVRIEGVSPKGGVLRLGLYDATGYPDDDSTPIASADVPAQAGEMVVTLSGLRPGTYAIEAFQDINANGEMDTSWFGIPEEPFGFSRDARPHLSKPRFGAVAFALHAGANRQTLHLQNSISLIALRGEGASGL